MYIVWQSVLLSDKVLIHSQEDSGLASVVSPNLPRVCFPLSGTFRQLAPPPSSADEAFPPPVSGLAPRCPYKAMFASHSSKQT